MSKLKVLYICQEIEPYSNSGAMSPFLRLLPLKMQETGKEMRLFTPRYGCINERRGQLHEVIRLSGMNLIINDNDHQLIIKVASIPGDRMQVYFIDNEDLFKRKAITVDENGKPFDDNDERAIFFARGVLETVKKLRWTPDIIHCHGWFSAIVPAYVKHVFRKDPIFTQSKLIISSYQDTAFDGELNNQIATKLIKEKIQIDDKSILQKPDYNNFMRFAMADADALIQVGETNKILELEAKNKNIITLNHNYDDTSIFEQYHNIYEKLTKQNN